MSILLLYCSLNGLGNSQPQFLCIIASVMDADNLNLLGHEAMTQGQIDQAFDINQ